GGDGGERRLAASVGADQADAIAPGDRERRGFDQSPRSRAQREVGGGDHGELLTDGKGGASQRPPWGRRVQAPESDCELHDRKLTASVRRRDGAAPRRGNLPAS